MLYPSNNKGLGFAYLASLFFFSAYTHDEQRQCLWKLQAHPIRHVKASILVKDTGTITAVTVLFPPFSSV